MTRLPEPVKRRIVEHLASYQTPTEVAELISVEFNISLTPRHVRAYDPTSPQFVGAYRWEEYHQVVRERCDHELGQIAIANKAYRLTQLQRILDDAMERGNHRLALRILVQAAREMVGHRFAMV